MKIRTLAFILLLSAGSIVGYGQNPDLSQDPNLSDEQRPGFDPGGKQPHSYPFRAFLNKFSVNLSTGYGRTFYRHDLSGFGYVRNTQGTLISPSVSAGSTVSGYRNWLSEATPGTLVLASDENTYRTVAADEGELALRSGGYSIPVNLSLYYNLFRVRVGGGAMIDFHRANLPAPDNFLTPFPEPDKIKSTMLRYYFLLGYSAYEYYDNAIGVDVRIGSINMGKGFDDSIIEKGPFFNVGITLEKVFSEYFRVYLRPAYEYKRYTLNLPDTPIEHRNSAFFITLGVSINYPDLPRSPIRNDKTQMRHYVSDGQGNKKEFRGQPFWRKQDPKIGELYPELLKTKRQRRARVRNFFKKD